MLIQILNFICQKRSFESKSYDKDDKFIELTVIWQALFGEYACQIWRFVYIDGSNFYVHS